MKLSEKLANLIKQAITKKPILATTVSVQYNCTGNCTGGCSRGCSSNGMSN